MLISSRIDRSGAAETMSSTGNDSNLGRHSRSTSRGDSQYAVRSIPKSAPLPESTSGVNDEVKLLKTKNASTVDE